jgi:hypothetical protein
VAPDHAEQYLVAPIFIVAVHVGAVQVLVVEFQVEFFTIDVEAG